MPSPVHFESHGEPHADIIGWLSIYRAATPGVRSGNNVTVRLDGELEGGVTVTSFSFYSLILNTIPSPCPNTSGKYICSAWVGMT